MAKIDVNESILERMFTISRLIRDGGVFHTQTNQLTLMQFQALIFVSKKQNVTMSDIANYFSITLPTTTTLVDKLIKSELITRESDEKDRRIVRIVLSKKGCDLLKEMKKARNKKLTRILSYLSEEERIKLYDILTSLQKRLEDEIEK